MTVRRAPPRARAPAARELERERRQLFQALHPVVQMLSTIVGPHIEIVLHDLLQPQSSIVAIANGHVSGRRVGHSILSGPKDDRAFADAKRLLVERGDAVHSVVGSYPTRTRSGRPLHSSTVVFRDASGEPFAALCLNADLSIIEAAHAWLGRLLPGHDAAPFPPDETPPDKDALMQEIVADAVRRLGKPVQLMDRDEKIRAVQAMMQRGLFHVKGGVVHAAAALGVSRFTIHNYLDTLRRQGA